MSEVLDGLATKTIKKGVINALDALGISGFNIAAAAQDYSVINFAAADTSYTTWDLSWADEVVVTVARTGATDTMTVHVSADGSTFSPVVSSGRDASTGAFAALSGLTSGQYTIPMNGRKIKFTKSGTTDTFVVTLSAKIANRQAY